MKDNRELDNSEKRPAKSVEASKTGHSFESNRDSAPAGTTPAQSTLIGLQHTLGNRFVVRMLDGHAAGPAGAGAAQKSEAQPAVPAMSAQEKSSTAVRQDAGQPLDPQTRTAMESRLGEDFSQVRIHNDSAAGQAAKAMHAQAFTVGHDIYFDGGKYKPDPRDPLLAHELTHVAQQRRGAATSGSAVAESELEAQAERAETPRAGVPAPVGKATLRVQRKASTTGAPSQTNVTQQPSFLERIGHGIASAAGAVWHGLEAAGRAVWKGVKAVGHGIAVAAEAVWTGLQWVGRQLWDKVTGIFQRVAQWVARLPERLGRLVMGLWEGVKSLHPWSLKWWESLGHASTWLDFLKWLGKSALHLAEVLGIPEVAETMADLIKFNTRKLSGSELSKASSVFGSSINFDLVRIDAGALIGPSWTDRPYTTFHTINGWGGLPDHTLIHELTHVWQYEHAGAIYIAQALHAQITLGSTGAYDYSGVSGLQAAKAAGQSLMAFNREQQAQIVEDFYLIKTGGSPMFGSGTTADLPLYAHFVKTVSTLSETQLVTV